MRKEIPGWIWWLGMAIWLIIWDGLAIFTEDNVTLKYQVQAASGQFYEWVEAPRLRYLVASICLITLGHLWKFPKGLSRYDPFQIIAREFHIILK